MQFRSTCIWYVEYGMDHRFRIRLLNADGVCVGSNMIRLIKSGLQITSQFQNKKYIFRTKFKAQRCKGDKNDEVG